MVNYRDFVGLSGNDRIPDRVSILHFRHLLEANDLSPRILQIINDKLSAHGLMLKRGSVVDATLIAAPSSTKNNRGERDPEMHQTKKGNQRTAPNLTLLANEIPMQTLPE